MENQKAVSPKLIKNATKWSMIAEISAKLIVPLTNMVLARLLAPEVFGLVAVINMVISFCDMFTTAGFQRYIIQHEYENENALHKSTSVAFWSNLGLSLFLWIVLVVFRSGIASMVGCDGYGFPIAVAGFSLPLTAFSSIQSSLYKRKLDYKTLFLNRVISIILPFVVTIPLAFLGAGYWALIIGTIAGNLAQGITLTVKSDWKPNFYFNFKLLKEMLSFSLWTLMESLALWGSSWIDIFIISNTLTSYYTGLYRTGQSTVTGIFTIITSVTTGVLFSALSRTQNNDKDFYDIFNKFQKNVGMLVLPMGVGMLVFSDLITRILLGEKWIEVAPFIGIWGFCTAFVATFGTFSREAYRAKGRPKISLIAQILHLIFVIPVCYYSANKGFSTLIYFRSFAYLQIIAVHLLFMKFAMKMPVLKMFTTTFPSLISACIMGCVGLLLKPFLIGTFFEMVNIFICIIVYFSILILFPSYRTMIFNYVASFFIKLKKRNLR